MHPQLVEFFEQNSLGKLYAKEFRHRVESGEFKITVGCTDWPEGSYANPLVNRSFPFVFGIAERFPEITDFHVYYYRHQDFHHIEFPFLGDNYRIQWYKIASLIRKSDDAFFHVGQDHWVYDWLEKEKKGRHPKNTFSLARWQLEGMEDPK